REAGVAREVHAQHVRVDAVPRPHRLEVDVEIPGPRADAPATRPGGARIAAADAGEEGCDIPPAETTLKDEVLQLPFELEGRGLPGGRRRHHDARPQVFEAGFHPGG